MYGTAQANGKHCESVIQGMETDLCMAQLKANRKHCESVRLDNSVYTPHPTILIQS